MCTPLWHTMPLCCHLFFVQQSRMRNCSGTAYTVRKQIVGFVKHSLFVGRVLRSYDERAQRAIKFAQEDDAATPSLRFTAWPEERLFNDARPDGCCPPEVTPPFGSTITSQSLVDELTASGYGSPTLLPKAPSVALMGLSLTGEQDRIHHRSKHYGPIELVKMRGVTRQAPGGMLLTAPTLNGRMRISLTVDKAGVNKETLELFWTECQQCVWGWLVRKEEIEQRARL